MSSIQGLFSKHHVQQSLGLTFWGSDGECGTEPPLPEKHSQGCERCPCELGRAEELLHHVLWSGTSELCVTAHGDGNFLV